MRRLSIATSHAFILVYSKFVCERQSDVNERVDVFLCLSPLSYQVWTVWRRSKKFAISLNKSKNKERITLKFPLLSSETKLIARRYAKSKNNKCRQCSMNSVHCIAGLLNAQHWIERQSSTYFSNCSVSFNCRQHDNWVRFFDEKWANAWRRRSSMTRTTRASIVVAVSYDEHLWRRNQQAPAATRTHPRHPIV